MWVIAAFIIYFIRRRGKPKSREKGISKEEFQARNMNELKDIFISAALGYVSYLAIVALFAGCVAVID